MALALDGRAALVTGGAGGIGRGVCEVLAAHGATVLVGYHASREAAEALAARLPRPGAGHAAHAAPVTDSAALAALAERIAERPGRLDILVNCHGTTRFVPAADLDALDDALFDRVLATNVRGTFADRARAAPPARRDGSGLVVNISSIAATLAVGSNIAYCASKAAVDTLTKSLALALAPRVRVVALAPGLVETEAAGRFERAFLQGHVERTPLARLATPRDIGEAVVALAVHLTAVTGVVIPVDAGRSLA